MKTIMVSLLLSLCMISLPVVKASDWNVESGTYSYGSHYPNPAKSYSDNGIFQINEPFNHWHILYTTVPQGDFRISLDVMAETLSGFHIMVRSDLPFAGSTHGINFEFGSRDDGTFLLARKVNYWTWNEYANSATVKENVWYTMVLTVKNNPYRATASAYDANHDLLWSYTATDMSSPTFSQLKYVGFGASENGGNYTIRNVSITSIDAVNNPTATTPPTQTSSPTTTSPSTTFSVGTSNLTISLPIEIVYAITLVIIVLIISITLLLLKKSK